MSKEAMVLRNAGWGLIKAKNIVLGDIVKIKTGETVPADVILIQVNKMKVNNAMLNGGNQELDRDIKATSKFILHSNNVAFCGTKCTEGQGIGVVFRTGDYTVLGLIKDMANSIHKPYTQLSGEMRYINRILTLPAVFLGLLILFLAHKRNLDIQEALISMIDAITAAQPQVMVAAIFFSLAFISSDITKIGMHYRSLETIQTFGDLNCVVFEKTGTLTLDKLTVSRIYYDDKEVDARVNWEMYARLKKKLLDHEDQKGVGQDKEPKYDVEDPGFIALVDAIAMSTEAYFDFNPTVDDLRQALAEEDGKSIKSYPKTFNRVELPELAKRYDETKQRLLEEYKNKTFLEKNLVGDFDEEGLVRFCQPLTVDNEFGYYKTGELQALRKKKPIVINSFGKPSVIHSQRGNKFFEVYIRALGSDQQMSENTKGHFCLYIRGDAESVLERCNSLLLN